MYINIKLMAVLLITMSFCVNADITEQEKERFLNASLANYDIGRHIEVETTADIAGTLKRNGFSTITDFEWTDLHDAFKLELRAGDLPKYKGLTHSMLSSWPYGIVYFWLIGQLSTRQIEIHLFTLSQPVTGNWFGGTL
ncbi:hypothetical protein [Endozoicomonas sp. 2B-B]